MEKNGQWVDKGDKFFTLVLGHTANPKELRALKLIKNLGGSRSSRQVPQGSSHGHMTKLGGSVCCSKGNSISYK